MTALFTRSCNVGCYSNITRPFTDLDNLFASLKANSGPSDSLQQIRLFLVRHSKSTTSLVYYCKFGPQKGPCGIVQADVLRTQDGEKKMVCHSKSTTSWIHTANPPPNWSIGHVSILFTCGTVYRTVGAVLVVLVVKGGKHLAGFLYFYISMYDTPLNELSLGWDAGIQFVLLFLIKLAL